ncbi:isoprenylcysteine carboxyl methyltransferase [Ceratobasidium sp. AG-Ba]|nr:isoprenylcysteine carboxyl methyltransferase [Ceratobasidium sp. AG-Ba]
MYFADLNIPISGPQALNAASWAATIIWFRSCLPSANYRANVEREAGPVKSMPPGKQGQLVSASRDLYIGLRLAGCAGALLGGALGKNLYKHLGSQWAAIGVRERPKLVKTGPYSVVRHPGYALALLQELFFIPMFWNWMFAPGFIIMAIGFAFKMPIEEKVIEDNKEIGDAYKQYKKDVPYRIIPYIW